LGSWPLVYTMLAIEICHFLESETIVTGLSIVNSAWSHLEKDTMKLNFWGAMRQSRLLVDVLRRPMEKLVERRSKGSLYKTTFLGFPEPVLLRCMRLDCVNAGLDDGIPTSCYREIAILSALPEHPNIVRQLGADVHGPSVHVVTSWVDVTLSLCMQQGQLACYHDVAQRKPLVRKALGQILEGVRFMHGHLVLHRNLKPDNIFVDDPEGAFRVLIGDFGTARILDSNLQSCTPEDPKERDRSGREAKRLWYRAPEFLMRQAMYGGEVDMWALGCLIMELSVCEPLFASDTEIDHVYKCWQLVGTPKLETWPNAVTLPHFSIKWPEYDRLPIKELGNPAAARRWMKISEGRAKLIRYVHAAWDVLGEEGIEAVDRVLCIPPEARLTASQLAQLPYFAENPEKPAPIPADHGKLVLVVLARNSWRAPTAVWEETARAKTLDWLAGIAFGAYKLSSATLHAAVHYCELCLERGIVKDVDVTALVCLKIADVFTEPSKEYYKQENVREYLGKLIQRYEAPGATYSHRWGVVDLVDLEKHLVRQLQFDVLHPTVAVVVAAFGDMAGLSAEAQQVAGLIADVCLMDGEWRLIHPAVRAMCTIATAVFIPHAGQAAAPQQLEDNPGWAQVARYLPQQGPQAARLCVERLDKIFTSQRSAWGGQGLVAISAHHGPLIRKLRIPEPLPVRDIWKYLL